MTEQVEPTEGWGSPMLAKKAHYFILSESLCGRWLYFGDLEAATYESPNDCAECTRRLAKREEKKTNGRD